jgi:hypothetical protein
MSAAPWSPLDRCLLYAKVSRSGKTPEEERIKLPMTRPAAPRLPSGLLLALLLAPQVASGHGGVVLEEDQCVLKMDFLLAHFTGYQPESRGSEEFCEDIPEVGESLFVLEYMHDFMKEMPVDFRIISDDTELGTFANWDDVHALGDLTPRTVFYQPPRKQADGVLTASHRFDQAGGYIGIVTASHPTQEKIYNAVFFFRVGGPDLGYLPLFVGLIILVQLIYWGATGTLQRFLRRYLPNRRNYGEAAAAG